MHPQESVNLRGKHWRCALPDCQVQLRIDQRDAVRAARRLTHMR